MTVTTPPRPRRPDDPVTHGEFDALVEALIEEARQRTRRRRRRNVAVVTLVAPVGVALFAVLGRSAQSQTASPALSARMNFAAQAGTSRIAFISEPAGGYCGTVWVMKPDGSGQRRLTNGGVPSCGQEWAPAWSPNGREIAFVSDALATPTWVSPLSKIYVMNADGSGERRLTSTVGMEGSPAWSPDGRKIAFTRHRQRRDREIYVVNTDGSGERQLTRNAGVGIYAPAWSPDGRTIAFVGKGGRGPGRHNLEIYVVNADGSGQRRLTRNTWGESDPVWSPDGRRIAFVRNWQVWVMNADGSGQRRLSRYGARNVAPTWSPDGRTIAFERGSRRSDRCITCPGARALDVYVMNADGSGQQRLTRGGSQPHWSPDGRKLAFVSKRDGNGDIFVMNADGSGQQNLTRAAGFRDSQPVWSHTQR